MLGLNPRLLGLSALAMLAFAANSILNRMALVGGDIDPASFALVRVGSAAVVLGVVAYLRAARLNRDDFNPMGALGLFAYMIGFAFAYAALDTGFGALLLFGGVQITMFIGAVLTKGKPQRLEWLGAIIAFAGLIYLFDPAVSGDIFWASLAMIVAAIGWGVFSLAGRTAIDPSIATAKSFLVCLPLTFAVWLLVPTAPMGANGVLLGVVSGAITSALGYLVWYRILPQIEVTTAAVLQLSVPLIAALGGVAILSEALSPRFILSTLLVLGGISISLWGKKAKPR
jgi:drug/metabolite transporter (DMT)-like permease